MIGVGDLIMSHLEEFVDGEIEELDPIEMQKRNELANKTTARAEKHDDWEHWTQSPEGGKLLAKKKRRVAYINSTSLVRVNAIINNTQASEEDRNDAITTRDALNAEKATLQNEIPPLVEQGKTLKSAWKKLDDEIKVLKDKLKEFTKYRRTYEDSYYTGMDRIFQDEGANRAAHFGRKFNGVNLWTIMDKANGLFGTNGRIRQYLIEKAPTKSAMIHAKCDDVKKALIVWDSAFSKLRIVLIQLPANATCHKL
jgi:chromosome segregation ATPase